MDSDRLIQDGRSLSRIALHQIDACQLVLDCGRLWEVPVETLQIFCGFTFIALRKQNLTLEQPRLHICGISKKNVLNESQGCIELLLAERNLRRELPSRQEIWRISCDFR
jgi:hypothetical protein